MLPSMFGFKLRIAGRIPFRRFSGLSDFQSLKGITLGEAYSLRKITNWLSDSGIPKSEYYIRSAPVSISLYSTGVCLKLDDELLLSIQTEPCVAGEHFCETALIGAGGITYNELLGYEDICRWEEPEDLFQHLIEIRQLMKDQKANKASGDSSDRASVQE